MDFFQGSIPPNFISFHLGNENTEEGQTPASDSHIQSTPNVMPSPPPFPPLRAPISPSSTDSNADVTAYAEERVRVYEHIQGLTSTPNIDLADKVPEKIGESEEAKGREPTEAREGATSVSPINPIQTDPISPNIRASTPTPGTSNIQLEMDLTQLESGLKVATSSRTTLPELLPAGHSNNETSAVSFLQHETDDSSSFCDAPELPQGVTKVRFLDGGTETEETGDGTSQISCPELYSFIPAPHNPTSSEEDTLTHSPKDPTAESRPGPSGPSHSELRELSGRSRAILKQYFDEDATTVSLPLGHRTVAFTEPQVYHLLRVLADETLRMSYTTMEEMVLGAVRGAPVTAKSRTDHFKIRRRAQTPHPRDLSDSSDGSQSYDNFGSSTDSAGDPNTESEDGVFDSPNETDSSAEMALISQAFKEPNLVEPDPTSQRIVDVSRRDEGHESTGQSSLDATLSELRHQEVPRPSETRKESKKKRRGPTRGVPMKEEFFAKIGWTRSFISGPADPLHNPHMVWCHICKKNFSVKTKGTLEILRHHRTEKHLRKDQRWRYEHLKSVHPVTGKVQHRVRGRNGKVLTKIELAKELPLFIHAELVDIGERFPFYDDFVKGTATTLVTPASRAKTQIHLIADFVQHQGDLSILRRMWSQVGSLTNYQASYCDFDWSEDRVSVGSFVFFLFTIEVHCKYPN